MGLLYPLRICKSEYENCPNTALAILGSCADTKAIAVASQID